MASQALNGHPGRRTAHTYQACCRCGSIEISAGWWTSPDVGDIGTDGFELAYTLCPNCSISLTCDLLPLSGFVTPRQSMRRVIGR